MVDGDHRYKRYGAVTVFADVGRLYVNRALARGRSTIVATNAVAHDARVIEDGR